MDNFLNGRELSEFKRYFKKMRKEEIKGDVETEFFSVNKIEVGSVVLIKSLLDGLGNTEMAFCGGKN